MNRFVIIVAAIVLVGGAGWYFLLQSETAQVTVRAELTAGGTDVTNLMEWSVAEIETVDGSDDLTLRTLQSFAPDEGTPFTYTVPSGAPLQVSGFIAEIGETKSRFTLDAGQSREEVLTLNAGLVNLSLRGVDRDNMRLFVDTESGGSGTDLPSSDTSTMAFAPGEYRISVGNDDIRAGEDLVIEAGQTYDVTLDLRLGDLTIVAGSWTADLPGGSIILHDKTGAFLSEVPISAQGNAVFTDLPFDEYMVALDHPDILEIDLQPPVILDAFQKAVDILWPATRVVVNYESIDLSGAQFTEIQIVETADRGIPYAAISVDGSGVQVLHYAPLANDPADLGFAVVFRMNNKVAAVSDIGSGGGSPMVEVAVSAGEGFDLCERIYFPGDCLPSTQ